MFYKIDFIAKELCFAYQTVIGLQFIGFAALYLFLKDFDNIDDIVQQFPWKVPTGHWALDIGQVLGKEMILKFGISWEKNSNVVPPF